MGFTIDDHLAQDLKLSTSSDFQFILNGRVVSSTISRQNNRFFAGTPPGTLTKRQAQGVEYLVLATPLRGLDGRLIGELRILRSLQGAQRALSELERNVAMIWLVTSIMGLVLTYVLTRQILEPVRRLDRAAYELAHQNYSYRVSVSRRGRVEPAGRYFQHDVRFHSTRSQ